MDRRKAKKKFKKDLGIMKINIPKAKKERRANLKTKTARKFTNWL